METKGKSYTEKLLEMPLDDIVKMQAQGPFKRKNFNQRNNTGRNNYTRNNEKFGNYNRYNNKYNNRTHNNNVFANKRFSNNKIFNKFDAPEEPKKAGPQKTRLKVLNLNKEFTNSDLKKLFVRIGELKRCGIHYDKLGNSLGIADVEYVNSKDAKKALEYFDNAEIEGQHMKIIYYDEEDNK